MRSAAPPHYRASRRQAAGSPRGRPRTARRWPTTIAGFARAFAWFCEEYNQVRPHEALGLEPPAHRFCRSARAYQPHPIPWIYPSGLDVRRVNDVGNISIAGAQYFISGALQGEDVACIPHEDRLLVVYRHMYVRELHPRSRRSASLMQPVDEP